MDNTLCKLVEGRCKGGRQAGRYTTAAARFERPRATPSTISAWLSTCSSRAPAQSIPAQHTAKQGRQICFSKTCSPEERVGATAEAGGSLGLLSWCFSFPRRQADSSITPHLLCTCRAGRSASLAGCRRRRPPEGLGSGSANAQCCFQPVR